MGRIEWANSLRGVAVLSVLVAHFVVAFWVNQGALAQIARRPPLYSGDTGAPSWARSLAGLPFEFSAFGVALFFLLSGYVIALSLNKYSRVGFLVGRLTRILPTYAAGYLITCLVVLIASDPGNELTTSGVLTGMVPGLPHLLGTSAPADGIVWTLIVELVFYCACIATYRHLTQGWRAITGVACACIVFQAIVDPLMTPSPLSGVVYMLLLACPFLPIMLVGVALSASKGGTIPRWGTGPLLAALVLAYLWLASTTQVVATPLDYRLTFAFTTVAFAGVWLMGSSWGGNRPTDFMANISYPLYVVHPVLGYFVLSLLAARGLLPLVSVIVVCMVTVGVAWILHLTVEDPTHRVGKRWAQSLSTPAPQGRVTYSVGASPGSPIWVPVITYARSRSQAMRPAGQLPSTDSPAERLTPPTTQ